ncbi:redoxin domain-containing protein [Zavarzinella formosa]|uniref:redoxin domain-containing protein n=1 Tax=Zavarzinella formosa TaxID=360055 RepID=UPI000306B621|nr:redoxin domain-containing protein [Zavarzinella formosa]
MSIAVALVVALTPVFWPAAPIDVELSETSGKKIRLSTEAAGRPVVVVLLRVDCPLAGRYGPRLRELAGLLAKDRVALIVVNADPLAETGPTDAFIQSHQWPFPVYMDPDGAMVSALGASRSPQAFVLDAGRRVRYRGRIDDQYEAGGLARSQPTRNDLLEAAREVAAGRPVSIPLTPATGCVIDPPEQKHQTTSRITFSKDVAPLLQKHCAVCHRPGEAAPFSLLSFADAKRRAGTIAEVVSDGRMPPWHAAPGHLRLGNDRRLPDMARKTILEWVRQGCAEGDPADLPPPVEYPTGWKIGTPDAVYPMPTPFLVPASGLVEYQHFRVDPGLTKEAWVRAIEVRPGNRRVVHHCSVFLKPPSTAELIGENYEVGTLRSFNLVAWTPGMGPTVFPPGMAKRIPAGWVLEIVVHYTIVGTPQEDRTEVGVIFEDPDTVRKEVATKLLGDDHLAIPPHAPRHAVEKTWTAERDVLLLAMFPHMHLRGKSFRYEADYPDGSRETLLDVPAYDFNWQHRYELAEPKRLPAGTIVRCVAVYDNSKNNPANPDPDALVRTGWESTDEMFNGYLDIALADQDMAAESQTARLRIRGCLAVAAILLAVVFGLRIFRTSNRQKEALTLGTS